MAPQITAWHIALAAALPAAEIPVANLDDDGRYFVAWGHVDKDAFLEGMHAEMAKLGFDDIDEDEPYTTADVVWCCAVTTEYGEPGDEWAITWDDVNSTEAFALTVLDMWA